MVEIFNSILMASFWGSCFTILFIAFNKTFKRELPVSWHYYIWLIVAIRLLVPIFVSVNIGPKEIAYIHQAKDSLQITAKENIISKADYPEEMTLIQTDNIPSDNQTTLFSIKDSTVDIFNQIFLVIEFWIIWLVIAIILIVRKFLSYFIYIKKLQANCILPNEHEADIFVNQKEKLNIKKNVAFFKHKDAQTPFAIGLFNLTVILPYKEYSDVQLNYIFHHELTHINRYDIGVKWLFEIAKAVHWFNPFVYIAAQNAAFYCESSCDEAILRDSTANERREYSMIILNLIEQTANTKIPICVSMHSNKSNLKRRIQYILSNRQTKKSMGMLTAITMLALALCACSSVKLKEPPQSEPIEIAKNELEDVPILTKAKTNILIAGVDNTMGVSRADTIIIASFDSDSNQISLLSIPRDTYLVPSEETVLELKQQGLEIPAELKFGEVTAYAMANGMKYLQKEISNTLGIHIDYYIKMDMPAFQKIIDAAGGVKMTIPEGGLYYSDPAQDLEISLEGGLHHLDGEKAMMLARYRRYERGDLDRINVQQQLLKALYSQILDGDNLIEKLTAILSVLIENTETNLSLKDFTPYVHYIPKLNAEHLQIFQLDVKMDQINQRFYAIIDIDEFERSIKGIFK